MLKQIFYSQLIYTYLILVRQVHETSVRGNSSFEVIEGAAIEQFLPIGQGPIIK